MKATSLYLAICVVGTITQWIFLIGFLWANGFGLLLFVRYVFSNLVATAIAIDLFASAALFLVFVFYEGRRLGMAKLGAYIPATLLLGLVFGAGLFLYNRARLLEQGGQYGGVLR